MQHVDIFEPILVLQQTLDCVEMVTAAGMHDYAGWFVDNQKLIAFMDHAHRQI